MARSDFKFSHDFRVRYAETDMQGVVFNAHYLTYFDTAITEYVRWLEFDYEAHRKNLGQDFHVVHVDLDFMAPCRFDDQLQVCVRVGRIGSSSLTFASEIFVEGDDRPRTSGKVIWVNTSLEEHKAKPLPEALLALLQEKSQWPGDSDISKLENR